MHIDNLSGNALCLQGLPSLQSLVNHDTGSDDGNVLAFLQNNTLAELELRAVSVNGGEALTDQTHVGELAGSGDRLGQRVGLSHVNGINNNSVRNGEIQCHILERHMGTAVVSSAYAGVRTQNVYGQLSICTGHESLVKCTTGGEAAEGMHPNGLAGSGQTSSNAHSVRLSDTSVDGAGRVSLSQLTGIDAAVQVSINVADGGISFHHLQHCIYKTVTVCTGISLVLANQSKAHISYPLTVPLLQPAQLLQQRLPQPTDQRSAESCVRRRALRRCSPCP